MRLLRLLPLLAISLAAAGVLVAPAEAAAPAVTFTPASLTFADQAIGTTSAPQSVTVTNTGDAPLFINGVSISEAGLDFNTDEACAGLTLAPGTSCSMSVTFHPTASGTRTATLNVTDNAAGSPQTVPLTGTGTGTNPPLAIDTQFFTCSGGVCDIGAGSNVFVSKPPVAEPARLPNRRETEGAAQRAVVQRSDSQWHGARGRDAAQRLRRVQRPFGRGQEGEPARRHPAVGHP